MMTKEKKKAASSRAWYLKNCERICSERRWKWKNDPEFRERAKKAHREYLKSLSPSVKAKYSKKYRANNLDTVRRRVREWLAKHYDPEIARCKSLIRSRTPRARKLDRLWKHRNRSKVCGYQRNWRRSNPHLLSEQLHRRRARLKAVPFDDCEERIQELRTCEVCFWCKRRMERVTIDHVIPLAGGGTHTPENLVAACVSCNCSKNDKLPFKWLQEVT